MIFDHVSKSFAEKQVLRDLTLPLPEKGVVALTGPSGEGKTTIFNLLLGILTPDSGRVDTAGKRFSVVFQEDRLLEHLSAPQNIRFVCPNIPDERAREHLACVGLAGEEGPVGAFSGGMKRRVAIVRAVLYGGDALLLDEPFKGMDEATRARTASYVRDRWPGDLILMITHDREEARLMGADKILEL